MCERRRYYGRSSGVANHRQSRRDTKIAHNAAHRHYGLLYDKLPMITETVSAPRRQRERGSVEGAVPSEHEEQSKVVSWWYFYARTQQLDWRQLVAIPNAQIMFRMARNPNAMLSYLHKEGLRDGAQDLVIFVQRPPFGALLVEMKKTGRSQFSDDQATMMRVLSAAGYRCEVCKGAEAAIAVIKNYVEGV